MSDHDTPYRGRPEEELTREQARRQFAEWLLKGSIAAIEGNFGLCTDALHLATSSRNDLGKQPLQSFALEHRITAPIALEPPCASSSSESAEPVPNTPASTAPVATHPS